MMTKRQEKRSASHRGDYAATSPASSTPVNHYLIFWPWNRCKQIFLSIWTNDCAKKKVDIICSQWLGSKLEKPNMLEERFKYQQGGTNEREAKILSIAVRKSQKRRRNRGR